MQRIGALITATGTGRAALLIRLYLSPINAEQRKTGNPGVDRFEEPDRICGQESLPIPAPPPLLAKGKDMIFVTVGTQMAFDRLVRIVDEWAGTSGRNDVFAQVGPTKLKPDHIFWTPFLDAETFKKKVEEARVIVAHAGMGSIISALQGGKPIVIMPRLERLGEHRNDHQIATAKRFKETGRVFVALDEVELRTYLDEIDDLTAAETVGAYASKELIDTIRNFINQ
ncbi:MAG: glycosyltransferase [Planctomycetota bacterium]